MEFDFRDMMGGAGGKLERDPALQDGASADYANGLHAHLLRKAEGIDGLVEMMARAFIWNGNAGNICIAAFVALTVERMVQIAETEASKDLAEHMQAEIRAVLDALATGAGR